MPHARAGDGTRIHYEVHEGRATGERPTVVLVQGLGLSSRFWFDQPKLVSEDRDAPHRVVVLDNRGTGRSDRPRGPYRMARMADDVAEVIALTGSAPAIVVGISMGGMIAQRLAIRHPDKVRGLVLLATTPGLPAAVLPAPRTIATLLSAPLQRKGGGASRRYNRLLLPEAELDRAHVHFARWPAALAHDPLRFSTFLAQFFAVMTHWTGDALRRIDCPAVVVHGAEDILVPPRNGERIARRIPNASLEILPAVAHAVPMLDSAVVQRSLRKLAEMGA